MKFFWILCLALATSAVHGDRLERLLAKYSDVNEIMPFIGADGERGVDKIRKLQKRALEHFRTPQAYELILKEGLTHTHNEYQQSTSDLLFETFPSYLSYSPTPYLSNALGLILGNTKFTVDELIYLRRLMVKIYRQPREHVKILSEGFNSPTRQYRKLSMQLLSELFETYDKMPSISSTLSYLNANGIPGVRELLGIQEFIYEMYPDVTVIPLVVEKVLSGDNKYRQKTLGLALRRMMEAHHPTTNPSDWMKSLIILMHKAEDFNFMDLDPENAFKEILQTKKSLSNQELLGMITPVNQTQFHPIFILWRQALIKHRPDARKLVVHDCKNFPHKLQKSCEIILDKIEGTMPEIYQRISELKNNNFTDNPTYREYQEFLESLATAKLGSELSPYFGEPISTTSWTLTKELSDDTADIHECPICISKIDRSDMVQLRNCKHAACTDCLSLYVATQFSDGESSIKCTHQDCPNLFSPEDLIAIGHGDKLPKLARRLLTKKMWQIPGAHFCPNENCPDSYIPPIIDENVTLFHKGLSNIIDYFSHHDETRVCATCNYAYCKNCKQSAHPNISCSKFAKTIESVKTAENKMMKGKNKFYKPCPRCSVLIEKHEGCDHMTCKNCSNEFYWSTLKQYP